MAVSLKCGCGARLEIDDKFAGKVIPCPDCQRPLTEQGLAGGDQKRISGRA